MPLDLERALAADYEAVAAAIEKRYGRLDGLLHNAALLGALTPIEQYDVPMFMRVMHVNVTAAFVLTQHLLPLLRASKDAAVLFTSSGVGKRGRAYWGAYSISKFAVEGFTQVLAHELEGTTPVRVNIIDPGKVRTSMRRQAYPSEAAGIAADAGVADRAVSRLVRPGEPRGSRASGFRRSRLDAAALDFFVCRAGGTARATGPCRASDVPSDTRSTRLTSAP